MVFPIRIKEAAGWTLWFSSRFNYDENNGDHIRDHFEDVGSNKSLYEKENHSPDPFNICDMLHKMDKENLMANKSGKK